MKMNSSFFLLFINLSLTLTAQSVGAAETDTFTARNEPLADSSDIINSRANRYVGYSLKALNSAGEGCVEEKLYTELRKYFNNHTKGQLTIEIIKDSSIPKRIINLDESVYRSWRPWDGLGMGLTLAKKSGLTVSPVIRFGQELVGTDKFEHMFGQGYYYFADNYLDEKGAVKATKVGVLKEKTILGGNKFGNGVFSYGDLSANFNGMRFWNHILQLREDVLGSSHNIGPYVTCENQKWVQVKKIKFEDYVDASMDEAINCSKYPAESTANRFVSEVKSIGMDCPLDPQKLEEMSAKYGPMSKWIINKDGPGAVKYFGEFKNKI